MGIANLEQHSFSEYGWVATRHSGVSISFGLIMGGLSLALLYGVQWKLGAIDWRSAPTVETQPPTASSPRLPRGLIGSLGVVGFWISATEELVFRGFLQFQLQQDYSIWVAAAIASTIFALSIRRQKTLTSRDGMNGDTRLKYVTIVLSV